MVHALNTAVRALAGTSIATTAQGSQQHEPAKDITAPFSPTTASSNTTTATSIQTPPASASLVEHKYHEICHPCHCAGKNASEIAALNAQRQQHGCRKCLCTANGASGGGHGKDGAVVAAVAAAGAALMGNLL
ncbi:04e2d426-aac3-4a96-8350-ac7a85b575f4 [Thermothielavioides terrestris]|uniref:04e2d426-aac3-4a96-8350-ac7a85b575f4 n=1 Tax=Thermothielavioides terrestris TaxID=2587410 RepID=A0A3S4BH28_9PEZI|nr:04e2d426-aac3-4a96-8350-ac7a85b575f4 [Thermothielavioides terrestris]